MLELLRAGGSACIPTDVFIELLDSLGFRSAFLPEPAGHGMYGGSGPDPVVSAVEFAPLIRDAIVRHGSAALCVPLKRLLCASARTSTWMLLAALSGAAERAGIAQLAALHPFALPRDFAGSSELLAEVAAAVCDSMCASASTRQIAQPAHRQLMLTAAYTTLVLLRQCDLPLRQLCTYMQATTTPSQHNGYRYDSQDLMKTLPQLQACLKALANAGFDVSIATKHIDLIAVLLEGVLGKLSEQTTAPNAADLQVILEMAISFDKAGHALKILSGKPIAEATLVSTITNLLQANATHKAVLADDAWAAALLGAVKAPPTTATNSVGSGGSDPSPVTVTGWCTILSSIVKSLQQFDEALRVKNSQPTHLAWLSRILCAWAQDAPKVDAISQLCISLAGDSLTKALPLVPSLAMECAKFLRIRTLAPLPVFKPWGLNVDLGCPCMSCSEATAFLKAHNRDSHHMRGEAVIFNGHTTQKLQAAAAVAGADFSVGKARPFPSVLH
jgi:hypothetical protein